MESDSKAKTAWGHERWMSFAISLVVITMAYNCIEAVLALYSGIVASSIALVGFGFDSVIELAAATALLWRLRVQRRGEPLASVERSEKRVHRFIGGTFLALAAYVLLQSGWMLWSQAVPEESVIGIALAGASLVVMPLIAWGKFRSASELGSDALRAEAKETLACCYLSFTLLLGLVSNALAGWWWADPVAAMLMVPWLVKEGVEGIRGGCCSA